MLLAIDVGNTNITCAVIKKEEFMATFRMTTKLPRTSDEFGMMICDLLKYKGIDEKEISDVIIASVVPGIMYSLTSGVIKYLNLTPMIVGEGTKTGIRIDIPNPKEVGADRVVDAVAGYTLYGGPVIVVDFGTATTFDVISEDCSLLGVVIAPGIKTSLEGLVSNTAQLPMIELEAPTSAYGKNTKTAMQAGVVFGFAGLVENIVNKIKKSLKNQDVKVVATGGLGEIIAKEVKCINYVDRTLTLRGLEYVYKLNKQN